MLQYGPMHSRTGVAAALGVPLVLLPAVASLVLPGVGAPLLWISALVASAAAAVAGLRSRGLDRAGWLLFAAAMALNGVANLLYVAVGPGLGLTPSVMYAVATCLILQAVECVAGASARRLTPRSTGPPSSRSPVVLPSRESSEISSAPG